MRRCYFSTKQCERQRITTDAPDEGLPGWSTRGDG
nr:MAG TPA: hypothetical protein [Caudoviricetes sp.]